MCKYLTAATLGPQSTRFMTLLTLLYTRLEFHIFYPEDSLWHTDEHLKNQAPKLLRKYLKSVEGRMTYMQNDQLVVSKEENKNKTKTKEQAAAKSRQSD